MLFEFCSNNILLFQVLFEKHRKTIKYNQLEAIKK